MDAQQVRARIMEVGQLVKAALIERGLSDEDVKRAYKLVDGKPQPRPSPFWSQERGYKYIDDVNGHLRRLGRAFDQLDPRPASAVFEIGPGSCYFLFLCQQLRGCRVAGVDWIADEAAADKKARRMPFHELQQFAFGLFRHHLGLADAVKHQVVKAHQPIAFGGQHDAIVATRAMFNHGWREDEYRFWLKDCHEHLRPEGKLMIALSKVHPEALAVLPFLRPVHSPGKGKKLNILCREEIGRVLGDPP
jgi:SAM-dependent methyltransferase